MPSHRRRTVAANAADSVELPLIASTVTGLEPLAAGELTERGHRVVEQRRRLLLLASPPRLGRDRPRLVDDLLALVAEAPDPGPTKADLARLGGWLRRQPLTVPSGFVGAGPAVCAVSASIQGRRTYNRYALEAVVGAVLARRFGWHFAARDGGARPPDHCVEWRVLLSDKGFVLGLRGRRLPLHRRAWKTASIPGSLHPPVAAALVRLAEISGGMTVLDPCCGAGTILGEAALAATPALLLGADRDPAARAAAVGNLGPLPGITVLAADAARLPLPSGTVDRIVTNPAWGRQVPGRGPFAALLAQWRRVIAADGRLVCLIPQQWRPDWDECGWSVRCRWPVSLSGRHPLIVVAEPR